MSKPLICCLGSEPEAKFHRYDDYDWLYIQPGDSIFEKLGDRLPVAIVKNSMLSLPRPAYEQLNCLPGFAVGRLIHSTIVGNPLGFVDLLTAKRPLVYYISNIAPTNALHCIKHMTFDQFYDKQYAMEEAYLFFDARLHATFKDQNEKMCRFYETTWQANLSQFRGFVSKFMHVLSQDVTPQVELKMLAMANEFPQDCYDGLCLKPMHHLFEHPSQPRRFLATEEECSRMESFILAHKIIIHARYNLVPQLQQIELELSFQSVKHLFCAWLWYTMDDETEPALVSTALVLLQMANELALSSHCAEFYVNKELTNCAGFVNLNSICSILVQLAKMPLSAEKKAHLLRVCTTSVPCMCIFVCVFFFGGNISFALDIAFQIGHIAQFCLQCCVYFGHH